MILRLRIDELLVRQYGAPWIIRWSNQKGSESQRQHFADRAQLTADLDLQKQVDSPLERITQIALERIASVSLILDILRAALLITGIVIAGEHRNIVGVGADRAHRGKQPVLLHVIDSWRIQHRCMDELLR